MDDTHDAYGSFKVRDYRYWLAGGVLSSMGAEIQQAANEFVNSMRADDRIAIITFSKELELICDFTSDRTRLKRAIENIRWGGSTRLYDAVYATMIDSLKAVNGRKAMILLTDGDDTRSRLSAGEAINAAVEAGAIGYVLQYPLDNGSNIARRNRQNDHLSCLH